MRRDALVVLAFAFPSAALSDRVDDYVRGELAKRHIPGAWVVVRKDGKAVKIKGYGKANLEQGTPVTLETRMQTGSVGKIFTATGIMALVQDGKLRLENSIAAYFPNSPEAWKPITVRHLLTHTSGIPDYEGRDGLDYRRDYSEDELVRVAQGLKLDFEPGARWSYSNTGYVLLGILIHKVTGEFYGDYLRSRVWNPEGLSTIRVINDREVIPHRSAGYDWQGERWLNQDWVSVSLNSTADGSLYATPADMVAWDAALDRGRVLSPSIQESMWTSAKLPDGSETHYGYGWEVDRYLGHRNVGHAGNWQGFSSYYVRFRDDRISVAVFANRSGDNLAGIAREIAARYGRLPTKESLSPIADDPSDLRAARQIVEDLMNGKRPTGAVSGTLANLSEENLAREKSNGASRGPVRSLEAVFRNDEITNRYTIYRVLFERATVWYRLDRNRAGEFTSLRAQ